MNADRREGPEGHETLTAVIVTWKSGAWLRECLRSLRVEDRNPTTQVVVVSNTLPDGLAVSIANEFPAVFRRCATGSGAGRG